MCAHCSLPGVCDIGCWEESENFPSNHIQANPELLHLHQTFLLPLPYPFLENRHCLGLEIPYSSLPLSPLRAYKNWVLFPLEVDSSTPVWDMSHPLSRPLSTSKNDATTSPSNSSLFSPDSSCLYLPRTLGLSLLLYSLSSTHRRPRPLASHEASANQGSRGKSPPNWIHLYPGTPAQHSRCLCLI